jgi:hypothetical protein
MYAGGVEEVSAGGLARRHPTPWLLTACPAWAAPSAADPGPPAGMGVVNAADDLRAGQVGIEARI